MRATVLGLVRACHAAPCVAVTVFGTALGASVGNTAGTCALLAAALLSGQLSIGWSNDRIDAPRDREVGRTDKPMAVGALSAHAADTAVAVALVALVALSFTLGWPAALLNLATVASGWAYNLRLKATWFSAAPYAFSFGALPGVATLAAPGHPGPAAWAVATGALLGVAANLTNALPDLDDDRATGVRGLPHRIGGPASLVSAAALLVAATVCVVFGPPGSPSPVRWVGLGLVLVAVAGTLPAFWRRPGSRRPFAGLVLVVAVDVVLLVAGGHLH